MPRHPGTSPFPTAATAEAASPFTPLEIAPLPTSPGTLRHATGWSAGHWGSESELVVSINGDTVIPQ